MTVNVHEALSRVSAPHQETMPLIKLEEAWHLGLHRCGQTRFLAATMDVAGSGLGFDDAEAERILASLPRSVQGLSVIVDAPSAGTFQVGAVIRYPHLPRQRASVDLRGSYDDYVRKLRSNPRRVIRRSRERCASLNGGVLDFRVYRRPDEVDEFVRYAAQLTKLTHQWKKFHVGIRDDEAQRRQILEDAKRDTFRGYILFAEGKPIAYNYSYAIETTLHGKHVGYDPQYRSYYPGFAIFSLIFEDAFQERFTTYDLGYGDQPYKAEIATTVESVAIVLYLRRGLKNLLFAVGHHSHALINRKAGRLAKRLTKQP